MTATAWPPRQYDDGPTEDPTAWMAGAPCRQSPDLFFSEDPDEVKAAKRICRTQCATFRFNACRAYALQERIEFGTWGGQSEAERMAPLPGFFRCESCKEKKKDSLRRGKWCAACRKRWRLAGRPASGPPVPQTPSERGQRGRAALAVKQSAETAARVARYAEFRAAGMTNAQAAHAVGVSTRHGQVYARRLADLPVAETADVHPWRQGDAVIPRLEATA